MNALQGIVFPKLQRPAQEKNDPPTSDLVNWAIRMYCYSLLSHFREMLGSFIRLVDYGLVPASFVVARCLFEMAAHAYYVHKHVKQYRDAGDLKTAWEFLFDINMGSRYMREEYGEGYEATSREIAKVIRCFDEWVGQGNAITEYSFLSEFAHPNMAALSHYYTMTRGADGFSIVTYVDPRRDIDAAPWPQTSISLVACLHFVARLLEQIRDSEIFEQIMPILEGLER